MDQSFFHLVFVGGFIVFWGIRAYYNRKARTQGGDFEYVQEEAQTWRKLLGLPFFLLLIAFLVRPSLFSFAEFPLPQWAQWLGVGLAVLVIPLIAWIQWALDVNFNSSLHLREEHSLVTHGPYKWVRHPMYTVMLLYELSILLLTRNLLFGGLILVMQLLVVITRVPREEQLMLDTFGEKYQAYMQQTGRFIPRLVGY